MYKKKLNKVNRNVQQNEVIQTLQKTIKTKQKIKTKYFKTKYNINVSIKYKISKKQKHKKNKSRYKKSKRLDKINKNFKLKLINLKNTHLCF